jgi:hypothetical protein
MLAKLHSYTLVGIDATPVEVEVDVSPTSMPRTVLVGLAEAAVRQGAHRVQRAIVNSGYRRPLDRGVINLAPARIIAKLFCPVSPYCHLRLGAMNVLTYEHSIITLLTRWLTW